MFGQGFTDAETEIIRQGVADGLSYADIAAKIPGRTIAAIGSKASRLGLVGRKATTAKSVQDALRLARRESQQIDANANVTHDNAFQEAMRKAIAAGLEYAEEGVSLVPCTDNPRLVRPPSQILMRSSALMCFEHGDRNAGGPRYF